MTKEEMNKIKEDIIKRIDRGESTDDVLKNSGAMQLNVWEVFTIFADIFKMKGLIDYDKLENQIIEAASNGLNYR